MTTSEIKAANLHQLNMRLNIIGDSTLKHQQDEEAAIMAEIAQRQGR
jgi:hypothetical protein